MSTCAQDVTTAPYKTGVRQESIRTAGRAPAGPRNRPAGRTPPSRTDPSKYRDRIGQARDEGRNGNSRETTRARREMSQADVYVLWRGGRTAAGAENMFVRICAEPAFVGVAVVSWKCHKRRRHETTHFVLSAAKYPTTRPRYNPSFTFQLLRCTKTDKKYRNSDEDAVISPPFGSYENLYSPYDGSIIQNRTIDNK